MSRRAVSQGIARLIPIVPWIPAALFVVLPGLLVSPGLAPGKFLYGNDVVGGFYHLRGAIGKALAEGRLPVWESHVMCGSPELAALHGGVLYPLTWPAAFMSPGFFWTSTAWIHLSLAGAFSFAWLGRGMGLGRGASLAGALLYMLSGLVSTHVYSGHVPHLSSIPWAAAILWRLERLFAGPTIRRGMLLAFPVALMILAGFPQFVFVAGLAALGRLIHFVMGTGAEWRGRIRVAGTAFGWMALGGILAAPQLLPTSELILHIQRVSINDASFVGSGSMAPTSLITLLAPTFFGDERTVPLWSRGSAEDAAGFVGIAGLALATLGVLGPHRQRYLWAGLAGFAIVLALGWHTPLFGLFMRVVPGVSFFRVPARYLFLFLIGVTPLAAMGFEQLWSGNQSLLRQRQILAGIAGILLLIACGFWIHLQGSQTPGWWRALIDREPLGLNGEKGVEVLTTPEARAAAREMAAGSLLWSACSLAIVAVSVVSRRGPVSALVLGLFLSGELWVYCSRFYKTYSVQEAEWRPEFVDAVRHHPHFPFRIATVTGAQTPTIGMCQLAGLDHVGGYDPMMLRRYTELVNAARGKPISDVVVAMVLARPGPVFDLLGARLWVVPGPRQEPPGWKTIGELPSGFVYENPKALPRAFLVGSAVIPATDAERLRILSDPAFDGSATVVLEPSDGVPLTTHGTVKGSVKLAKMDEGYYSLRTDCATDAFLVLSEAYFPGWSATVDGAAAPILRADHLLQAVRLKAGAHEVIFAYHSRFLWTGFLLATAGLLIPLLVAGVRRGRGVPGGLSPGGRG